MIDVLKFGQKTENRFSISKTPKNKASNYSYECEPATRIQRTYRISCILFVSQYLEQEINCIEIMAFFKYFKIKIIINIIESAFEGQLNCYLNGPSCTNFHPFHYQCCENWFRRNLAHIKIERVNGFGLGYTAILFGFNSHWSIDYWRSPSKIEKILKKSLGTENHNI